MYHWHSTSLAIIVSVACFLLCSVTVEAQDISALQGRTFCGIDRNGDGDYDGEGEIADCENGVCPLSAAECVTNRVEQVCEPDTTQTSCAPDEIINECEPDTVGRECEPDTTRQVCEPDATNRTCTPERIYEECDPDTTRRECDPDTTRRVCGPVEIQHICDPDQTTTVCDPNRTTRVCDPDRRVYECEPNTTRRECDPSTTTRQCDPDTTTRVCSPSTTRRVCDADTVRRVCTTVKKPGCGGRHSRTCTECTVETVPGQCRNVSVPGTCRNETTPGACRNVTTPGRCRNVTVPGACGYVTYRGACRNVTVAGQCREVTERGRCRTVEIPGSCEDVRVPGACRTVTDPGECRTITEPEVCTVETIPGACETEVVPGECEDVRVPGECSQRVVKGECVQITVPGECRDEPLLDSCPLEGVDECFLGNDGVSRCSDTLCVNTTDAPIEELQRERVAYVNDGTIDASGECLNDVQVFTGRGMDCQRPGLLTLFKNCCKNRGEVLRDSGGGLGAAATVSTVTAVFSGASAAVTALANGATAASAASIGSTALAAAGGPALVGAGVYLLFTELLGFGCDQQDFETAVLDGSGMCHSIGSYCVARIPLIGCIQKARSFCCFNSKLGRIIHEQGRSQLINFDGFGTAKAPECRGFTPAEFQALNFSDMDLSEYYDELAARSESQLKDAFEQGLDSYIQAGKGDGS